MTRTRPAIHLSSLPQQRVRLDLPLVKSLLEEGGWTYSALAHGLDSWRAKGKVAHSTISRVLRGERSLLLHGAQKLAAALHRDVAEIVVGYVDAARLVEREWWQSKAFLVRHAGSLVALARGTEHLLHHVHVDGLLPPARHRVALSSPPGPRFAGVLIRTEQVPIVEIIISFRFELERLPLIVDYGRLRIDADEVNWEELWTGRGSSAPRPRVDTPTFVRSWIDGVSPTFFLRSDQPFRTEGRALVAGRAPGGSVVATFHPTLFHQRAHEAPRDAE